MLSKPAIPSTRVWSVRSGLNFKYQIYVATSASRHGHHSTPHSGVVEYQHLEEPFTTGTAATPFTGDTASVSTTLALSGSLCPDQHGFGTIGCDRSQTTRSMCSRSSASRALWAAIRSRQPFCLCFPFQVAPTALTLDVPVAPAPPGATCVAPTAASALAAGLNPTQSGSVCHRLPQHGLRAEVRGPGVAAPLRVAWSSPCWPSSSPCCTTSCAGARRCEAMRNRSPNKSAH